jgi:S-methylmethionine-dependent homocysteine/selenocysteine methylase
VSHSHSDLAELLQRQPLVLDGATGTELERRGVDSPLPLWSAGALISHPDIVEAIHSDYVAAGAEIIIANTFRTNVRTLRAAGMLEHGEELNRAAINLARSGGQSVIVAASVAPVEDCYRPDLAPDEALLRDEHGQMLAWLEAAGPDLIWIETMGTVLEARAAAQAASKARMPFVVSFVTREDGNLLGGEALEEAVDAVEQFEPTAIGLNCIPPTGMTATLPRLREATARPLAAYAHINNATPILGWSYAEAATPEQYGEHAQRWLDLGASIVGGCCGTTPAHIRAVKDVMARGTAS